jgi:OTT_1508-like deaminase
LEHFCQVQYDKDPFYVGKILLTESKWQKYKAHALGSPEIIQGIKIVFVRVDKLIAGCKRFQCCQQAKVLSTEADQVLKQAHEIRHDRNFQHLPHFGKVGKGIKDDNNFLGRLLNAWESIISTTLVSITLKFLTLNDTNQSINQETLQEKINSYPQNMDKRNTTLKILEDTKKYNFAVHYEMQLFLHFDASDEAKYCFPYFGCSKLSCWMCNEILESYSRYRTKRSHGRIVGLWAFDSTDPSSGIIFAPKRLQDKLTNKLVEEVVRAGVFAKEKSLKSSMFSKRKNHTSTQAEAYTNINRLVDEADKLTK